MTSPDEMKAREIANALRVNASTTGADAEEELIAAITQALSEKTEEIERASRYYNELCEELQAIGEDFGFMGGEPRTDAIRRVYGELKAAREAAEARLSEVVEEIARFIEDHQVARDGTIKPRRMQSLNSIALSIAIRARFQNGGKDNG